MEKQTLEATEARIELGKETDQNVLHTIKKNPGRSIYQIAKILNLTVGRTSGSVTRLLHRGEINSRYVVRDGKYVKEIYPKHFIEKSDRTIRLDKDFSEKLSKMGSRVYFYGLDRNTLGISSSEIEEWKQKALFSERAEIIHSEKEGKSIRIPEKLADFYLWENSHTHVTLIDDGLLVTVETQIPIVSSDTSELEEVELLRSVGTRDMKSASVPSKRSHG